MSLPIISQLGHFDVLMCFRPDENCPELGAWDQVTLRRGAASGWYKDGGGYRQQQKLPYAQGSVFKFVIVSPTCPMADDLNIDVEKYLTHCTFLCDPMKSA